MPASIRGWLFAVFNGLCWGFAPVYFLFGTDLWFASRDAKPPACGLGFMMLAFVMAVLSPLALGSLIVDADTMREQPREGVRQPRHVLSPYSSRRSGSRASQRLALRSPTAGKSSRWSWLRDCELRQLLMNLGR